MKPNELSRFTMTGNPSSTPVPPPPPDNGGGTGGGDVTPSDNVIHVSTGQELQTALAQAAGKTVTIQLNGSTFTAAQADAQGGFASMFTGGRNSNVTLIGSGILDGQQTTSTVGVHYGSTLTINGDITITGGEEQHGGGIYNDGTVDLKNGATVTGNRATDSGGGVYNGYEDSAHPGTLTLEKGTTITSNEAIVFGVYGGGIANTGTLTVNGGTISGNVINDYGGTIFNQGGKVTLNGGSITGDTTCGYGVGIYNYSGTVTGSFNGKGLPPTQDGGWSWIDGQGWQQETKIGDYNNTWSDIDYHWMSV